jgi:disulfide bond formation protein DsbB
MEVPSPRKILYLIIVFCLVSLGAAYIGEYFFHLIPCKLCLYQRYTLILIAFIGFTTILSPRLYRIGIAISTLLFFLTAGIAFYQVALENHLIHSSCVQAAQAPETIDELREHLLKTPLVNCDQIQWSFYGISLAGFNGFFNLLMGVICLVFNFLKRRR